MGIFDYFKPVSSWPAEKVRQYLQEHKPDEYNLLDVRQPKEYEREHLPGAVLITMSDLPDKMAELGPEKTTLAYCGIGVRNRAAASMLRNAGFREAYSMEGGIKLAEVLSWAEGQNLSETLQLAISFEANAYDRYLLMVAKLEDEKARNLFRVLAEEEKTILPTSPATSIKFFKRCLNPTQKGGR
jgi:rhodanese-related sulfurtransferase